MLTAEGWTLHGEPEPLSGRTVADVLANAERRSMKAARVWLENGVWETYRHIGGDWICTVCRQQYVTV